MSVTQGGQTLGQTGLTRRRLAAGEAKRGGEVRVLCSGCQNDGGAHLRVAGSEPRRVVVVAGLGVAGNDAGDESSGCRSSGEVELVGAVLVEVRGVFLQHLHVTVKLVGTVAGPLDGRSLVGDELRGGACR